MNLVRCSLALVVTAVLAGSLGCRPAPPPERLVTEADALRQAYDKASNEQALTKYVAAMSAWDRRGEKRRAAAAALAAGDTSWQLGRVDTAITHYRAALDRARGAADRLLESETRSRLGTAGAYASDPEAGEQCSQALALARDHHGEREQARAMDCLGEAAYFAQSLDEALDRHQQAERLWTRLGDRRGMAEAVEAQGYVHSDLGRLDQANDCFERARAVWDAIGDRREQAIGQVAAARLLARRGNYEEALQLFVEALARLEPMGNALWQGSALSGLANVHQSLGDIRQALHYWEGAIGAFEMAGLRSITSSLLMSVGYAHLGSGNDTEALARFERALALANELPNDRFRALALRNIGTVHLFRRQAREALKYLGQSMEAQRTLSDVRLAGWTHGDLGKAYSQLGDFERAAGHFGEALAACRSARDRVTEARVFYGLAEAALGRDDPAGARAHVERALSVVESLRTSVEDRDLRASYFASVHQYHELHLDVLMQLRRRHRSKGLAAQAFEASERARARSLLESLSNASVDLRAGADRELLRREQMARAAFDDWSRRRQRAIAGGAGRPELDAFAAEYRDLEATHSQVEAEIRRKSPRYAALVKPRPLGLREAQSRLLDPDTLLLEYALGERRSYLWAIDRKGYEAFELPPRAEIERVTAAVREHLTSRASAAPGSGGRATSTEEADEAYWRDASRLSDMLLGPASALIAGKRLAVIADGALQYLPFAALPAPGNAGRVPLLASNEVVYLPSASVLDVLRRETTGRPPAAKSVAVLADPVFEGDDPRLRRAAADPRQMPSAQRWADQDPAALSRDGGSASATGPAASLPRLASTRQEADAILAVAREGSPLRRVDFDASRKAVLGGELAGYRIVHFATHGVFDNENPELSGIALSMFDERGQPQDGFLRLHDIYTLNLTADLVVMSACDTALGRAVRGEGLVGLVRGFMYAGVPRVVASLWKVGDEAAAELMRHFYQGLLGQGRPPADALRQAQLAMWRQDRWREPHHWAAFVIQGEWR